MVKFIDIANTYVRMYNQAYYMCIHICSICICAHGPFDTAPYVRRQVIFVVNPSIIFDQYLWYIF